MQGDEWLLMQFGAWLECQNLLADPDTYNNHDQRVIWQLVSDFLADLAALEDAS